MHLGDFGAALRELDPAAEKDTFGFFGEQFKIVGVMPPMLALQMGAVMTGKLNEVEGAGAMWEALNIALDEPDLPEIEGPDERPKPVKQFARFYRLAIDRRCDEMSLMTLAMSIFQNSTGERPTVQVPDSPVGESPTSPSSSTSYSPPQDYGEHDPSVPHLVPVSRVLAG